MQPSETSAPVKFRKLRIAWSVFWGVACVLLVMLWVRSYSKLDAFLWRVSATRGICVDTGYGTIALSYCVMPKTSNDWPTGYRADPAPAQPPDDSYKPFSVTTLPNGWIATVPVWFATVTALGAGALPLLRRQFSLRTLLIATTLVAAVLGLAVYASSK